MLTIDTTGGTSTLTDGRQFVCVILPINYAPLNSKKSTTETDVLNILENRSTLTGKQGSQEEVNVVEAATAYYLILTIIPPEVTNHFITCLLEDEYIGDTPFLFKMICLPKLLFILLIAAYLICSSELEENCWVWTFSRRSYSFDWFNLVWILGAHSPMPVLLWHHW